MRTCTRCGKVKPLSEFHKHKNGRAGVRASCVACGNTSKRAWRAKVGHARSDWSPRTKANARLRPYGLSACDFTRMRLQANDACAICGDRATVIDHCHETGKVRGLLCRPCNIAIGLFNDDLSRIESALVYLAV